MAEVGVVMDTLDSHSREMDDLSRKLADVERRFEPVEARYESFLDAYSVGLWEAHKDGDKLPGEDLRLRLARKDMPATRLSGATIWSPSTGTTRSSVLTSTSSR